MTVLDGLEVKVAFGDVWKKSLTELSGGQRSVILHTKNNYRDLIRNSQVFLFDFNNIVAVPFA